MGLGSGLGLELEGRVLADEGLLLLLELLLQVALPTKGTARKRRERGRVPRADLVRVRVRG